MTPESLDKYLRNYTTSELRYQQNERNTAFDKLPVIERNGQKVYFLNALAGTKMPYGPMALSMKKQARFSSVPMHIHNWIEINYIYSGHCPQIINHTSYNVTKGQVVLIDRDTPHSTGRLGENDIMVSLMIDKNYLNSNFFTRLSNDSILSRFFINAINENTQHDNYILFHSENSRKLPLYFNELMCEYLDPSMNSPDIINSLITLLFCELINVYRKDLDHQENFTGHTSVVQILRYIENNYKNCTLESTAAFFNLNPNYLSTLLKKKLNYTYKELVQHQRLSKAAQLLRNTDMTVTEVANDVGYENINFFYKKFKEQYCMSPKEYRLMK